MAVAVSIEAPQGSLAFGLARPRLSPLGDSPTGSERHTITKLLVSTARAHAQLGQLTMPPSRWQPSPLAEARSGYLRFDLEQLNKFQVLCSGCRGNVAFKFSFKLLTRHKFDLSC